MNLIDKSAIIQENYIFGNNVTIYENVEIGKNVKIGNNVVIYPKTRIGNNVEIQDNAIIGKPQRRAATSSQKLLEQTSFTKIGDDSTVGALCVLYEGTQIGTKCFIGDLASIREGCFIGDFSIIGRAATVEYNTRIGQYVKIQTACHITGNMIIEDHVFFGPEVTTMNDNNMDRGQGIFTGPHVKRGALVGGNATLLPGVTLGEECLVGAGSVVTKDIPPRVLALGIPAKPIREVPGKYLLNKEKISL